ncbi:hypothetical protein QJQ45_028237 [Haematococcus lacustris]|nr:hypothetical protein QJQ45_028237 [Haematococcus lacustris]
MDRRSQRSKKGSATMAARVAASLAPWTRKAGFIAKRSQSSQGQHSIAALGLSTWKAMPLSMPLPLSMRKAD